MGYDPGAFLDEIQKASERIERGNTRLDARLDGFEANLNALMRERGRPGTSGDSLDDSAFETKSARQMCLDRRALSDAL